MNHSVAVIIPALNEAATIGQVVTGAIAALSKTYDRCAVFVVDDGSSDRTAEIAAGAGARVIFHRTNMGVGAAFRSGLHAALKWGATIIVNMDGDGQFDPARIPDLAAPVINGEADAATASRFADAAMIPEMPRVKLAGNMLISRLISMIAGRRFHDVSCGFRVYNRDTALMLNLWGDFTYTQESLLDLVVKGRTITEVPMRIIGVRPVGASRVASNLWRYGTRALHIILHTYLDYWPMRFFGGLSLPFLCIGTALCAFLLVHRVRSGMFTPHIWAGFSGAAMLAFGVVLFATGLIGTSLKRIRLNQETILYYHRKQQYMENVPEEQDHETGSV
ncbi:MAG: glycosyltransferase family 2 protein [Lentisphaerae bacterium]|nr:glycosyltransferase family 2 protein [Lentisphaerota bacterium]